MTDEKWKALQGLKDELFATRTEADFNEVVNKIGSFVKESDMTEPQKQKLREYTNNLKEKKKAYWEKYGNKPQYQRKEVYLLRPETETKLQQLLDVLIAKYSKEEEEPEEPEQRTIVTQYPSANEGKLAEECDYPIGHKRIGFKQYDSKE